MHFLGTITSPVLCLCSLYLTYLKPETDDINVFMSILEFLACKCFCKIHSSSKCLCDIYLKYFLFSVRAPILTLCPFHTSPLCCTLTCVLMVPYTYRCPACCVHLLENNQDYDISTSYSPLNQKCLFCHKQFYAFIFYI